MIFKTFLQLIFLIYPSHVSMDITGKKIGRITESMGRILEVFAEAKRSLTPDVLLGLIISKQLLLKTPKDFLEIQNLIKSIQIVINGINKDNNGYRHFSPLRTPFILNASLWKNAIQPLQPLYLSESVEQTFNLDDTHQTTWEEKSDICLRLLFVNYCKLEPACFAADVPDFSYETTHKLLYFQVATGLHCRSWLKINLAKKQLCSALQQGVKSATQNINTLRTLDLILEAIALCSVEGYYNFVNMEIVDKILAFESNGCFNVKPKSISSKRSDSLLSTSCHSHTNAVGLTCLAGILRAISYQN